jgi:hypothetical protein
VSGQVEKTALYSLGGGLLCQFAQEMLQSQYLTDFLQENLINLLAALLAVNSATVGIVLTKVRELIEKYGHGVAFKDTKEQLLLSVKEQLGLIVAAVVILTLHTSKHVASISSLPFVVGAALSGVFIYAMVVLYDVAKSVLIIIDFDPKD